jgi:hypothetical protein
VKASILSSMITRPRTACGGGRTHLRPHIEKIVPDGGLRSSALTRETPSATHHLPARRTMR